MTKDDLEAIQRSLDGLKAHLDGLTDRTYAYFMTLFQILEERGLVDRKEAIESIEANKRRFAKACRDAEFLSVMRQLMEDESSPPPPGV